MCYLFICFFLYASIELVKGWPRQTHHKAADVKAQLTLAQAGSREEKQRDARRQEEGSAELKGECVFLQWSEEEEDEKEDEEDDITDQVDPRVDDISLLWTHVQCVMCSRLNTQKRTR